MSQRPFLQNAIDDIKPHIIALQETHLTENNTSYLSHYHSPPLRKDRENRRGGGVALFIHNNISFLPIVIDIDIEIIAVKILLQHQNLNIYNIYFPPDTTPTTIDTSLIELQKHLVEPFIITMDANAHHVQWGSPTSDHKGNIFASWINDNHYVLLNNGEPTFMTPTGTQTHIDITICSTNLASTLDWKTHYDPCNSDHLPIIINSDNSILNENNIGTKWNLNSANWTLFRNTIQIPNQYITPNQACEIITQSILTAAKLSIKTSTNSIKKPSAYWWNKKCTIAKRNKNRSLTKYKNHIGDLELWIDFKKNRAIFRKAVKEAKKESWKKFLNKLTTNTTSSEVWKHLNMLRSKTVSKNITLKENDTYRTDPKDTTNILAKHFSDRSNGNTDDTIFEQHKTQAEKQPITFPTDNSETYNTPISLHELKSALATCSSRSPGPDTLPYAFIQNLTDNQLTQLLNFFNYIFTNGFPDQWRQGIIIPLPKPNKPTTQCESFRPITLTNCLSKLLEKILNRRLQHFLEDINFYNNTQSGFRASHSTMDGLIRYQHAANSALREGKYCVAVFLDVSQAFDTVWHHGLLETLRKTGLAGKLAKFLVDFLKLRKISVKIGDTVSESFPLYCGVPQGSVLSPTLFTIMINSIFDDIDQNIETSLYADDGAMWIVSEDLTKAIATMQDALNKISIWSHTWGLKISSNKTIAMITTFKHTRNPIPLSIDNQPLTYATQAKFLGVIFDNRLTWNHHINYIKDRCEKDLQLLRIISYNRDSSDYTTLKHIYTSLILSKIDYASFLYINASDTQLNKLNRIQISATRTMLGALRNTPAYKLEIEANVLPLKHKRKQTLLQYGTRMCIIQNHPIRNYLINCPSKYKVLSDKHKLSSLDMIHKEIDKLDTLTNKFSSIPMKTKYIYKTLNTNSTLATVNKDQRSESQWQALHKHMIDTKYPTHIQVYTDGSNKDNKTGCGVWSPSFQLMCRLPDKTTIFTAELHAIYIAIKHITNIPGNFIILTDSLSAIRALQTYDLTRHYIFSDIYNTLIKLNSAKITFEWIPSHMGIHGNEKADRLASMSINIGFVKSIAQSRSEIRRCIVVACESEWGDHWKTLSGPHAKFKPDTGPTAYVEAPRSTQVAMSRLRLGTTLLTHGHYFKKSPPNTCPKCNCRANLHHIFVQCPQLSLQRKEISDYCQKEGIHFDLSSILSPPFPFTIILKFLQDAGIPISEI